MCKYVCVCMYMYIQYLSLENLSLYWETVSPTILSSLNKERMRSGMLDLVGPHSKLRH